MEGSDKEILNWSYEDEGYLNVISVPYNTSTIFIDIIMRYISEDKKILYISNENEDEVELLSWIKRNSEFRGYEHIRQYTEISGDKSLFISNFTNAIDINIKFDLLIYDEIKSFPKYNKYEILDLFSRSMNENGKAISYSIERFFNNTREILIPLSSNKLPMVEPRVITTRIDMNKEIPYVVYDYMKWSILSNRNVVIFVPDEEKLINTFNYLLKINNGLTRNIYCYIKNKTGKKELKKVIGKTKTILITNDNSLYSINKLDNVDIMVFFANSNLYDYKQLVYFCAIVGRGEEKKKSEVLFLANSENQDMKEAKKIIRNFNKQAWDMGLINI